MPPTLIEVQSWKSDCKCAEANFNGGEACTCSHDPASYTAEEDFKEAMEDWFARARLTGKADAIAQRKRNMQTTAVTRVNGDLVNAILAVTNKVPQLAHCKELLSIKKQTQSYSQLEPAQIANFHLLPLADLLKTILWVARSGTGQGKEYLDIFAQFDLTMTLIQHQTNVDPAFDQLEALKTTTSEQLLDVLKAMSSISFIAAQAADRTGNKRIRDAYQRIYTSIMKDMEVDPQPFTMIRLSKFQEHLRIELSTNNLTDINTDREQGQARTSHFTRTATGKATNRRMKHLEQKIKRLEAPNSRTQGRRGTGEWKGGACLVCGELDHPAWKCTKANRGAVLSYEKNQLEKTQQVRGRNQARALRRLQKDSSVSDNESEESEEEEWDNEDERNESAGVAKSVKSNPYLVSSLKHNSLAMRTPPSVTFSPTATVREYTPACWLQKTSLSANWSRYVLKLSIVINRASRKLILRTCPILKSIKLICRPHMVNGQQSLHHVHDISIMDIPLSLCDNTKGAAVRSLHHDNSVVHMYTHQVSIQKPPMGAVVDTGAQRSATSHKSEIMSYTNDSFLMQGATGISTPMCGILMGIETVDIHGKSLLIVAPDVSVSNPAHADSLLSAGRFMEAGYKIVFRIPSEAHTDGYSHKKNYGGIFCTPSPNSRIILMEYENETWRLPLPKGKEKHIKSKPLQMSNPYAPLRHLTEQDDQDELNSSSDVDQARFELQRKREREVSILHDVSHRHNRGLLEDLKAAGVETKHLQKYILAHRCKWCEANRGKRTYLVTTRQTEPAPLTISTIVLLRTQKGSLNGKMGTEVCT